MTDRAAFLAAINAAPDDDAPRLVYADWLDIDGPPECRDSARAEFIRVQCELDAPGTLGGPLRLTTNGDEIFRQQALLKRERELWYAGLHRFDVWHLPDGFTAALALDQYMAPYGVIRRGFVHVVTCAAADCLAHLDAVLAEHPVREVRLTDRPLWQGVEERRDGRPYYRVRLVGRAKVIEATPDARDMEEALLRAEWPSVKTWHLPPEPQGRGGILAVGGERIPLAEWQMEMVPDEEDAAPLAAPDYPRRPGHSRMPGWLVERRQRPSGRR